MEGNVNGVMKEEWYKEDLKALTSQLKEHESLLRLKRRWLMDLPLSQTEEKRVEELLPLGEKILPESLLREDDVSYEDIKACIEKGFGACKQGVEHKGLQEDAQIFKSHEDIKDLFFLLDGMTNKGLYAFAKILTGGIKLFEKTNWSMRRTIKQHLPNVFNDKSSVSKIKLKQLSQLLKDPINFRGSEMASSIPSEDYCAAAAKVLDVLEDFCFRTLNTMHRKLRGVRGFIPTMQPVKSGRRRDSLISSVRKRCLKMLSNLSEGGKPAEELASALGIAGLALKLLLNRPIEIVFRKFSPEVEALQVDIAKAIWLLKESKQVSFIELKKAQVLLDPNVDLSVRSLRMGVRNLLTEYLFECSDMDVIPDFLVEALDIINRKSLRSHKTYSFAESHLSRQALKEKIQKEIELVLTLSAQTKEVLLDQLSEYEFDEDFAHAYMEDFEESDSCFASDDDDEQIEDMTNYYGFHSHNLCNEEESVGETSPAEFNSPVSMSDRDGCSPLLPPQTKSDIPLESMDINEMDFVETSCIDRFPLFKESKVQGGQYVDRKQKPSGCTVKLEPVHSDCSEVPSKQNVLSISHSYDGNSRESEETKGCYSASPKLASDFPVEEKNLVNQESGFCNSYLEVQEACDATSTVAYRFVGHMLAELASTGGIEMYQNDRLYLLTGDSFSKDSEESSEKLLSSKLPRMWKDVLEHL